MSINTAIVEWSKQRPLWQQDALRRLVERPLLTDQDIDEITALCKQEFAVTTGQLRFVRLADVVVPEESAAASAVSLLEIRELSNVNALRPDQRLSIAPAGLTVIYGDNGAGKSGYVRVIKQLCRARGGAETIYPNVYKDDSTPAHATIRYSVGGGEFEVEWTPDADQPDELTQISMFDSRSASVYVGGDNEVAYLPKGMDLFPRLAEIADIVRSRLEEEFRLLELGDDEFATIPQGTDARTCLSNLHLKGARTEVEKAAVVTPLMRNHLEELSLRERKFKSDDPVGHAKALRLCVARLKSLQQRLHDATAALSEATLVRAHQLYDQFIVARDAAEIARLEAFDRTQVPGTGSDAWHSLWTAARAFSADGGEVFPPAAGARCVLCQQPTSSETGDRMRRFDLFIRGTAERALEIASQRVTETIQTLSDIPVDDLAGSPVIEEISSLDVALGGKVHEYAEALRLRRKQTLRALQSEGWDAIEPLTVEPYDMLSALIESRQTEAIVFEDADKPEERIAVANGIREIEAKIELNRLIDQVQAQIDRERQKAAIKKCMTSASTRSITTQNTEMLAEAVSKPLADEFTKQRKLLRLGHIPMGLEPTGGKKGRALHRLNLSGKSRVVIPKDAVLSEGEHRAIALAAFFSEVSLQDSRSMLVLDDPVSSLDQSRRQYVANRLVDLAASRPVLVFTHDMVFLWMLQAGANSRAVTLTPRLFRRDDGGAGLVSDEFPWDGQRVKQRIGALKNFLPALVKLAAGDRPRYENEIRLFYGRVRDTWERSVEEVLLQGAIRRFGPDIKTQSLRKLYRIPENLLKDLEAGMSKTSSWIQGHDHAVDLAVPVPEPDEATADVQSLEKWVDEVNAAYKGA